MRGDAGDCLTTEIGFELIVFMATTEWLEAPPADWTPFDSFPDVQEEHELTVGDGYIFVKDPQQEFQRYSEGSTRMGYYLGIVLF